MRTKSIMVLYLALPRLYNGLAIAVTPGIQHHRTVFLSSLCFSRSRYLKHSILLFFGLTQATIPHDTILSEKRNAKGILLFPLASMMADDMNGPTNDEVFPMIEKKEKKRNSFPRGHTSEIILT